MKEHVSPSFEPRGRALQFQLEALASSRGRHSPKEEKPCQLIQPNFKLR